MECLPLPRAANYTCAPCSITIEGVKWAAGKNAANSCPVDNSLTHFALRASKDHGFANEINNLRVVSMVKPVQAFAQSVTHAIHNDSVKSHNTWLEVLKAGPPPGSGNINGLNSDGTWYGGTDERFYDYLNPKLSTFVKRPISVCSGSCTVTAQTAKTIEVHETRIPLTTRPVHYFKKESDLYHTSTEECSNNKQYEEGACRGLVDYGTLEIPPGKTPPLYLVARNSGALNGPEDFLQLPKVIQISDEQYQLGMLTLFDRDRGHFTSLHNVENEFVYYDGISNTKNKFRRALPSDYKQEDIYMDHALYVRTFNNKKI